MSEEKEAVKKTAAAIEAFKQSRLRWVLGVSLTEPKIGREKYEAVAEKIVEEELERQMLVNEIRERGPLTIKELSDATNLSPKKVFRHVIALRKYGVVSDAGEKGEEHLYKIA